MAYRPMTDAAVMAYSGGAWRSIVVADNADDVGCCEYSMWRVINYDTIRWRVLLLPMKAYLAV